MNRNGHRMRVTAQPDSSDPVRSASTSVSVGRSVKVKTVASSADQNRMNRKAIQGTPGWKYCHVAQSSRAKGLVKANLMKRETSEPASLSRLQKHPSNSRPTRTSPAQ